MRNAGHAVVEIERPLDIVSACRVVHWDSVCIDESQLGRDTLVVLQGLGIHCRVLLLGELARADVTRIALPLDPEELIAALADQRRLEIAAPALGESDIRLDRARRVAGGPLGEALLTRTETRLLELLLGRRPGVVPIDEILREVWGYTSDKADTDLEIVRTHVRNLRRKLEPIGFVDAVQSQRGRGYRLVV
jgi:hypothetical protein